MPGDRHTPTQAIDESAILPAFEPEHAALWGHHPLCTEHTLHTSPLFSDEALACLIEDFPRANYDLLHMAEQGTGNMADWREGDLGSASGADVLAAIQRGRLWLNLRRVHEVEPRYRALLEQIFAELSARMPGFQPWKLNFGILISSPGAQVYYHADVPGQSLWQIRGEKRVHIYPNRAPFLPEDQVEGIVLGLTEAEIQHEPWFDQYAHTRILRPGEMMNWPLNAPHRVENLDCLNISFTTEHWTRDIRNLYAVRYANGLIRRQLRMRPPPPSTFGLSFLARAAVAGVVKKSGFMKRHQHEKRIEWRLDPEANDGMAPIDPYVLDV